MLEAMVDRDQIVALDRAGKEPLRVQLGYETALADDPSDADLHRRYICFLLIRAQSSEAEQAFTKALQHIDTASASGQQLLTSVARHAVHNLDISLCRRALELIPAESRDAAWRSIDYFARAMNAAVDQDDHLPLGRWRERWWEDGPDLIPLTHEGLPLLEWTAFKISARDDAHAYADGAVVRHGSEPEYVSMTLPLNDLERDGGPSADQLGAAAADGALRRVWFAELGLYGQNTAESGDVVSVIAAEPPGTWKHGMPPMEFDPDRYLKRMFRGQ